MLPSMLIIGTTRWGVRDVSLLCASISLRHWFAGAGPLGEAVSRGTSLDKLGSIIQHSGKIMTNDYNGVDDG